MPHPLGIGKHMSVVSQEVVLELPNGYIVGVTPLPTYYMDVIKDANPYKEYPKRRVTLVAGDVIDWEYKPPDEEPDEADIVDYQLYHTWHSVVAHNADVDVKLERAKRDFLLAVCVDIKDGPKDVQDDDWVDDVEAAFATTTRWRMPTHPGARKIVFIKTQIITTGEINQQIMSNTTYVEVTQQGITSALRNF